MHRAIGAASSGGRDASYGSLSTHKLAISLYDDAVAASTMRSTAIQGDLRGDEGKEHNGDTDRDPSSTDASSKQIALQRALELKQRLDSARSRGGIPRPRQVALGMPAHVPGNRDRASSSDGTAGKGETDTNTTHSAPLRVSSRRPRSAIVRWTPANSVQAQNLKLAAAKVHPNQPKLLPPTRSGSTGKLRPESASKSLGTSTSVSAMAGGGIASTEERKAIEFDPKKSQLSLQSLFQSKLPDMPPAPNGGSAQQRVEWVLNVVDKDASLLKLLKQRASETRARVKQRHQKQQRHRRAAQERIRASRREWIAQQLPVAFGSLEADVDDETPDTAGLHDIVRGIPSRPRSALARTRQSTSVGSLIGGASRLQASHDRPLARGGGSGRPRALIPSGSAASLRPVSALRRLPGMTMPVEIPSL